MKERAQIALAAGIVAGSAIAGLLGVSFWVFMACGISLSLISLWDQEKLRPRFAAVGATSMLTMANLASLADSCLVTGAAWCVGVVFRFVLQSV
jgi:hypothetical protein